MKFLDYVEINPKISFNKGEIYPFVDMESVSPNYRNPAQIKYKEFSSGVKFQDGDTVIARITPCLQNGKRFYCKGIGAGFGSTEYLVFRPKKDNVDNLYLYYYMKTEFITQCMVNSMIGATGRQRVNNSVFKDIEINFPDIEIQQKIGLVLSAYDDLIENNQKQIKLLEEAAQRLYKEWFIDLHFPGWESTTIVDGVPEGWKKVTVADVSSVLRRGISPKYNDDAEITVINQKCIRQTIVDMSESRKQEKKFPDELTLVDSDTVICSTGAGTLGRVGQIFGDYPNTTLDSHVTLVRASDRCGKQYVFHTLKFNQTRLMGMGQGSTNQLELNRSVIQQTELLLPPEKMAAQFEKIAQPIHDRITALNCQSISLKEARDRLLPRLMNGELEV